MADKTYKHRSSYATYFFKYFFVPVWAGMFLFGIVITWNEPGQFHRQWSRGAAVMVSYVLAWMIPYILRLNFVKIYDDKILVRQFRKNIEIPYKAIDWVYEIAMINPPTISIKLRDGLNYPIKKLFIIPAERASFNLLRPFGESEMTKFIRQQVIRAQPGYQTANEPSRWSALLFLIVTIIPLILFMSRWTSGLIDTAK